MILALSASVAGAVALFILSPLLGWGAAPAFDAASPGSDRKRELLEQRQETLAALRDLQMEFEVGKLTREDYEQTRERLTLHAVEIYREMDKDGAA